MFELTTLDGGKLYFRPEETKRSCYVASPGQLWKLFDEADPQRSRKATGKRRTRDFLPHFFHRGFSVGKGLRGDATAPAHAAAAQPTAAVAAVARNPLGPEMLGEFIKHPVGNLRTRYWGFDCSGLPERYFERHPKSNVKDVKSPINQKAEQMAEVERRTQPGQENEATPDPDQHEECRRGINPMEIATATDWELHGTCGGYWNGRAVDGERNKYGEV